MLFVIILFLISIFTHGVWFSEISLLTSGDWHIQSLNTLKEYYALPQIWSTSSLGNVVLMLSFYPFQMIFGILSKLNLSYGMIERVLFMWPIVFGSVISSYFLIKKNFKSLAPAIIGSLVFTYNTYFQSMKTGHLTLLVSFALAPFIILLSQLILEKKEFKYIILSSLVGFVLSYYEFRAFYIVAWLLIAYFIFFQFSEKNIAIKSVVSNFWYAISPIIIVGILNLYWILGFSRLGVLRTNEIFNRQLFGNEFFDINYAITLFHPFWTGRNTAEFIVQSIPLYYWLIPLFAFLGLVLNRKNKIVIFFGFVALLGIFLTKQVGQPFSGVYQFLYENFQFFNAYREASKFYFLIALGYSVLIAAFVDWLWKNWTKGKVKTYGKYVITILIAGIFLWNTKPLITGEIGALFVPRTIPEDYKKIESHLLSDNTFYRTFWIPTYSRWSFYSNIHPQVSAVNELNGSWSNIVQEEIDADKYSEGRLMLRLLQKQEANNLLDVSSIKYVFVPIQDIENDDDFFRHYGLKRVEYINSLDKLEYLERVDLGTEDIVVYENSDYKPHVYTTPEIESINKVVSHTEVDFQFINPTQYTVHMNNVTEPVYLNFSESFHPQWKLRVGDFSWFDAITQSDYFVPDKNHSKNDASLNSYYIDPEEICALYECNRNTDGSYTMNMTLYFYPQSYVYVGGIISLTTLLAILGFFGFKLYEKKKK